MIKGRSKSMFGPQYQARMKITKRHEESYDKALLLNKEQLEEILKTKVWPNYKGEGKDSGVSSTDVNAINSAMEILKNKPIVQAEETKEESKVEVEKKVKSKSKSKQNGN